MKPNRRATRFLSFLFRVLLFCVLISGFGCRDEEEPPTVEQPIAEPVQIQKPIPANFIVCIDNSKSIRPREQVLIRETAMLLTDLVAFGDRISIITFGVDARIVASAEISTDRDRERLKREISSRVDFKENYSDIRAGLRLLATDPQSPLLHQGVSSYVVLLSDGKLEPADKKTSQAFDELVDLKRKPLKGINLYAIVLGDRYCNDVILRDVDGRDLTGKRLMQDYLATSGETFYHARSFDQLLPITVDILKKTKGITAIGEEAESKQFRIDNTVETLTLIVPKKSSDGRVVCQSSDILLNQPDAVSKPDQTVYRSSDYQYFDLFVVRNPVEGMWSVTLKNGQKPEVLSKIDTPIELRYSVRNRYYRNEFAMITAWMFDKGAIRDD